MIIGGNKINPGEQVQLDFDVARLPTGTLLEIQVIVNRSEKDGPCLLLTGGMHGDEINGVEIMRRVLTQKLNKPEKGTVICIPILNVFGFINFSREVTTGKDMNRSFPGSKRGSLASQSAYYLTKEILPLIDYGIDFHTGGRRINNFPQLRAMLDDPENQELASAFAAPFTLNANFRDKSFRKEASKNGKRIMVYEGGESLRLRKDAIDKGINGALRVMKYLGMRSDAPEPNLPSTVLSASSWVRARVSGMFFSTARNGKQVAHGEVMGFIAEPYGNYEIPVKAATAGHIIAINNNPVVSRGDPLVHVGFE